MSPYYSDPWLTLYGGDCRDVLPTLPDESVHCVVTSPPYLGLRDYGMPGQIGLERDVDGYVAALVGVFREVRRVLRRDGTVWLNLGDSYAGGGGGNYGTGLSLGQGPKHTTSGQKPRATRPRNGLTGGTRTVDVSIGVASGPGLKPKDLIGVPWRVAFALQADGWWLRSDVIWSKPNPMPESVTDRPTRSHEYVFLLARSERYFFDANAIREPFDGRHGGGVLPAERNRGGRTDGFTKPPSNWEPTLPGRNIRSVWSIATQPYPGAHFAVFPEALVEPCIKAGCPENGVVLDPFAGSGTVGKVAQRLSRRAILIDLNPDYLVQQLRRNRDVPLGLIA